ncbi:hypothetical protein QYE76_024309 [Lolium multiflorum]|uniref:DNA-directed RNA polymerase II subunit RPB9-like zinc ribbon domain-containing protein n=1 Tax=Lolium multiflorum TaxID=4521 RepID=A0AAD8REK7_LOLMU|nr:hypothetical protein QYE76_024309 [Lolium multiflorum]
MDFCPACGMLLQIQPATGGHRLRLFCPTCPYVCPIKNKVCPESLPPPPQLRLLAPLVLVPRLSWVDARLVQIVKKARLAKREVESAESAPKTDGEAKEPAPKTEGEPKQSAPKTEGELFTLLLGYWNNQLFSLLYIELCE